MNSTISLWIQKPHRLIKQPRNHNQCVIWIWSTTVIRFLSSTTNHWELRQNIHILLMLPSLWMAAFTVSLSHISSCNYPNCGSCSALEAPFSVTIQKSSKFQDRSITVEFKELWVLLNHTKYDAPCRILGIVGTYHPFQQVSCGAPVFSLLRRRRAGEWVSGKRAFYDT